MDDGVGNNGCGGNSDTLHGRVGAGRRQIEGRVIGAPVQGIGSMVGGNERMGRESENGSIKGPESEMCDEDEKHEALCPELPQPEVRE